MYVKTRNTQYAPPTAIGSVQYPPGVNLSILRVLNYIALLIKHFKIMNENNTVKFWRLELESLGLEPGVSNPQCMLCSLCHMAGGAPACSHHVCVKDGRPSCAKQGRSAMSAFLFAFTF